jgi:aspartyl-tRNA(Asn)/glutamyl-tRNA(Gln) amidotransferase subunit B
LYESGHTVRQATLGWDEQRQKIIIQRYKEQADEYRYFPEPDLPIVQMKQAWVDKVRARLPELPDAKQKRFMQQFGLPEYDARILVMENAVADFYEVALGSGASPKLTANWMLASLFNIFNQAGIDRETVAQTNISAEHFGELVKMVDDDRLNKPTGEKVLALMWQTGDAPSLVVEREGLAQVSDENIIGEKIDEMLAQNAKMVQDYLGGKDKLFGALMGKSMGALGGKGNPQVVTKVLRKKLEAMQA